MWKDDGPFACALQRAQQMLEEGIVAVLLWWDAILKATIQVMLGIETAAPGFGGKRRIGNRKIEMLELAVLFPVVRLGERVVLPNLCGRVIMQDHVHARQAAVALSIS